MSSKHSGRPSAFAAALKCARESANPKLTQRRLAIELDVDSMTVSRWERGEAEPNKWLWPRLIERFPVLAKYAPEPLAATGTDGR